MYGTVRKSRKSTKERYPGRYNDDDDNDRKTIGPLAGALVCMIWKGAPYCAHIQRL